MPFSKTVWVPDGRLCHWVRGPSFCCEGGQSLAQKHRHSDHKGESPKPCSSSFGTKAKRVPVSCRRVRPGFWTARAPIPTQSGSRPRLRVRARSRGEATETQPSVHALLGPRRG